MLALSDSVRRTREGWQEVKERRGEERGGEERRGREDEYLIYISLKTKDVQREKERRKEKREEERGEN